LEMDYERSVDKSYAKKRQWGSPNSYIEQIPGSTSGTTTNKNNEVPTSTLGTSTNIEQIPTSTTNQTNLFVGLSAEA
jgi:hypothetical protein